MKAVICSVLFAALGIAGSAYAQAPTGAEEGKIDMPGANWLFVQTADSITTDGKTITLRGSHPEPGGGKMTHRAVWKIVDNNTQTFDMYGAHHAGKEMKVLEITYQRKQ